jgi:DNA-binding TFAR19-related protein (PDSD5 family)
MAIKANQSQNKPNSSEPKKANVLARPTLTQAEKERLEAEFELMRPQIAQVFELVNSPLFEYQANLAKTIKELTAPMVMLSLVIAEQMSGISNLFKDVVRVQEMPRNLIEQSLEPMGEFQESIRQ